MSDERQHDSRYTQMVESSILNKVEINFTRRRALPGVLPAGVQRLVANSLSDATKRAYALDIAHFEGTGRSLPAAPETVAEYLAECAETYAVATLQRRLASVSKAHRALGADDPTKSELVRATMRGVRRTLGVKQRQAQALLRDICSPPLTVLDSGRRTIGTVPCSCWVGRAPCAAPSLWR